DLPFGWGFNGTDAKLSDIFAGISTRNMTPHERAAFIQGKQKELTEFFGNDVWEFHKPTGEGGPRRILKAKWVLKWTKNDDGTPSAKVPKDAAELMGIEPNTLMKLIGPMYGQVKRRFKFRKWNDDDKMDYRGSDLTQTPHWENPKSDSSEIEVKMATYAKNLKPITIDQNSSDNTREFTIKEKRQLRGLLGALQWPSSQDCPHLSASVSIHQGQRLTATVGTAKEANKTLRFYKQHSDVGLKMKKIGQVSDVVFVAMTDAARGVRQGGSRQGGYVLLAYHKKILDGHESDFSVIDWKSFKLLRMARSSLHAESQAAAAGMDGLEFAKRFWAALIYDGVDITKDESTRMAGESALAVDAKGLYDAAQKESITSFQDKRTGIEVLALRERMEATMTRWRWVSSERQYADGLAKIAARQFFADRLRYGRLQLKHDPNYTAAKKKTKEERQESIDQTRPVTSAATRKATTPFMQLEVFATSCCRSAAHTEYDTKNENNGYGILVWFAMCFLCLGFCGAYPVASYLIKIREAEYKYKTELAVLRAKIEKEKIEK
ncbi:unnamed protein product, partial [Prorocentrum cordatum]